MNEEDEEKVVSEEETPDIFECPNCGFMYNTADPPKGYPSLDNYIYMYSNPLQIKCPVCSRKVPYILVTKEKYDDYVKKLEKKREIKEKNAKKKVDTKKKIDRKNKQDQIRDDVEDLIKDLKDRLLSKEISPARFVSILSRVSVKIAKRYDTSFRAKYKEELGIDWLDFKKVVLDTSDSVLKLYKEERKSEDILEEYTENIEKDELYKAQIEYYIADDNNAIYRYELDKRMAEYERIDKKIEKEEYRQKVEEKYQSRRIYLLEKAQKRKEKQKLRDLV